MEEVMANLSDRNVRAILGIRTRSRGKLHTPLGERDVRRQSNQDYKMLAVGLSIIGYVLAVASWMVNDDFLTTQMTLGVGAFLAGVCWYVYLCSVFWETDRHGQW
jgi:hypothetical protein